MVGWECPTKPREASGLDPEAVHWTRLAAVVGDGVTLSVVCLLAVTLGVAFAWLTGVDVPSFAVGGVVAYAVGMAAIEVWLSPDSPAHLVWYAVLLACLVGGVALRDRLRKIRGESLAPSGRG
jgi:hypothetical protein